MAEYFINADTGNNGNDGSEGTPWETLAHAYDNSIANDTITCQDSTANYVWVADTIIDRTIQGEQEDASGAVFDAGGGDFYWNVSGTLAIKKITFQNYKNAVGDSYGPFWAIDTFALTMDNCIVRDIELGAGTEIGGIFTLNNIAGISTISLDRCIVFAKKQAGATNTPAIHSSRNSSLTFTMKNCVVYIEDMWVFSSHGGGPSIIYTNSIFVGVSGATWSDGAAPISTDITYCDFYNITNQPTTGTGVINVDPLFVDPDNADFNLRPASPCIDTGVLV